MERFSLNGDDWRVSGWWPYQWRNLLSMELGTEKKACVSGVPATVPGAVNVDLQRAGLLADPNVGRDSLLGEWVTNRDWMYDKVFTPPAEMAEAEHLELCFDGLDYCGEIYLNNAKIADFSGMFLPVRIDVTATLKRRAANHLRVVFTQSPEVYGQFGYSDRIKIFKSRFNYVWDWCPRIVPVGIWEDAYLRAHDRLAIRDFFPKASADGLVTVSLDLDAHVAGDYAFDYEISYQGAVVAKETFTERLLAAAQTVRHALRLEKPELWWPVDYGAQPLYDISVSCAGVRAAKRIGFRDVEFVQNEGAPAGALPYTCRVNGVPVFLKGVDWVPILPHYGAVTRGQYEKYVGLFRDMHANILRVWGGAILEKEDFYDVCDEMGVMVWQEFPQSSSGLNNTPPADPETLKALSRVVERFIVGRRHHASHVLWCGGNELMLTDYTPVTEGHQNIALCKRLVERLDPGKQFYPSSASGPAFNANEADFGKGIHHDVHGPWLYNGPREHYRYFNGDDSLFRSETGCPGAASLASLERYAGEMAVWPPDETNPYWMHRGAWWIQWEQLTALFGPWRADGSEVGQYVEASRYLQAEALRYAAEATLRRAPRASGFIVWMGNEPFPNAANTSVIEYDGTRKPAYFALQKVFRRTHVSLSYEKIDYASGEEIAVRLWATSDEYPAGELRAELRVEDAAGALLLQREGLGEHRFAALKAEGGLLALKARLYRGEELVDENVYWFCVDAAQPFANLRNLPDMNRDW